MSGNTKKIYFKDAFLIALFTLILILASAATAFGLDNKEYKPINSLPEDEQIVSGGYYVFSSHLPENADNFYRPDYQLLTAGPENVGYGVNEQDTITVAKRNTSEYDNDTVWNRDNRFVFQITATNDPLDNGNQGYTIKNVGTGKYLNLKQELQHDDTESVAWYELAQYYVSTGEWGTTYPVYSNLLPTYPFVYLSNTARTWYWDKENKEFYTLFTSRGYSDNTFGFNYKGFTVCLDPLLHGMNKTLACTYDDGKGNVGYSQLVWLSRYAYCDMEDLGEYYGADTYGARRALVYESGLYSGNEFLVHGRNSKFVLQGFAAGKDNSDGRFYSGLSPREELRDPHYCWGWSNSWESNVQHDLSTAMLGAYNDAMKPTFEEGWSSPKILTKRDSLSLYKQITSPAITFDYNDGTGGSRTEQVYYNQNVDLTKYTPYNQTDNTFLGWSATKHGKVITSISLTSDQTLYAQWKKPNITIGPNDERLGTVTVSEPEGFDGTVYKGDTLKATAAGNTQIADNEFIGWKVGNQIVSTDPTYQTSCTSDMTITAVFRSYSTEYGFGGTGKKDDPYRIRNKADWNSFAGFVTDGHSGDGLYFSLENDISVTTMVGTLGEGGTTFDGYFNGTGHTITFNAKVDEEYCAPFRHVGSAKISNLHVDGRIETTKPYAAGLIALSERQGQVDNCRSSIIIDSSVDGEGYHSGFLAYCKQGYTFRWSVFDGKLLGDKTDHCGGFVGRTERMPGFWCCVFDPAQVSLKNMDGGGNAPFTPYGYTPMMGAGGFYTKPLGAASGGEQGYLVTPQNGINMVLEGLLLQPNNVSGITECTNDYGEFIKYGFFYKGSFLARKGTTLNMTLPQPEEGKKYYASAGKLTGSGTEYQLVVPGRNVVISLVENRDPAVEALLEDLKGLEDINDTIGAADKQLNKGGLTDQQLNDVRQTLAAAEATVQTIRTTLDAMTDEQKSLIDDQFFIDLAETEQALGAAMTKADEAGMTETQIEEMHQANQAAADAVIGQINNIPDPADVDHSDREGYDALMEQVKAAEAAYAALTTQQKALVTNINVLIVNKQTYQADEIKYQFAVSHDLQDTEVVLSETSFTYNGKAQKPTIQTVKGLALEEDTDYTAVWSNASSTNAGTYTVTLTGAGDYTGTTTATYTIKRAAQSVTLPQTSYTRTFGDEGFSLGAGTDGDGTIKYDSNNDKAASVDKDGNVTIKGAGTATISVYAAEGTNYGKSETKTVTIKVDPKKVTVPAGMTLTYNGKSQTGVDESEYYNVTGNKQTGAGTYTATLQLKDAANYIWDDGTTDDKSVEFTIKKAANPFAVKVKTKTVKLKYSKVKKKAQTLDITKVITITDQAQDQKTYQKVKGNKKITINAATGKLKIRKGLKKGKYKVTVNIRAAGNNNYNASAVKTVSFIIKVK